MFENDIRLKQAFSYFFLNNFFIILSNKALISDFCFFDIYYTILYILNFIFFIALKLPLKFDCIFVYLLIFYNILL